MATASHKCIATPLNTQSNETESGPPHRGRFRCDVCQLEFPYKSKYERHLTTIKHNENYQLANSTPGTHHNSDTEDMEASMLTLSADALQDQYDTSLHSDHESVLSSECHSESDEDVNSDESFSQFSDAGEFVQTPTRSTDFYPFQSKSFALLYLLANSPRPMGETNLKFIWFAMSQISTNLPSLHAVKSFALPEITQADKVITSSGIPLYVNSPSDILKQCMGNPCIAKMIHRYPVKVDDGTDHISEMYHGERWWSDERFQSPMALAKCGQVFTNDFIQFQHARHGITCGKIIKFYMKKDNHDIIYLLVEMLLSIEQVWSEPNIPSVCTLSTDPSSHVIFEQSEILLDDIVAAPIQPPSLILIFDKSSNILRHLSIANFLSYTQPNELRQSLGGLPIVTVPVNLYCDDTSGNKSKKWNKFDCWTLLLAGLPKHENAKLRNIHFLTCSNRASVLEMAAPIASNLQKLEEGVEMYDAFLQRNVLVRAPVLCIQCDNPRAAELLNHQGGNANLYCRMCNVDKNGMPWKISTLRTKEECIAHMDTIKRGASDAIKLKLRAKFGLKEVHNPLLQLSVDLYQSTPVETLHTILLGPYKYLLKDLISKLNQKQKNEFRALVMSFQYSGFDVRIIGNIIYHHKSFVGRDYKAWAQMSPFIVSHFVTQDELKLWISLSKVFMIAYCKPFTRNCFEEHTSICQEFVDTVNRLTPHVLKKSKVHLILHLPKNMQDFGPTSAYNTERCESFNGLMRTQNIYSNKHAPSRDIAHAFNIVQGLRFICEGGTTFPGGRKCGEGLMELYNSTCVQRHLNGVSVKELCPEKSIYAPGSLRKKISGVTHLANLNISTHLGSMKLSALLELYHTIYIPDHLMDINNVRAVQYKALTSRKQQLVNTGNYVHIDEQDESPIKYGLLNACLSVVEPQHTASEQRYCILQELEELHIHNEFDCPLLSLTNNFHFVNPARVSTFVSVLHQCTASCQFVTKSSVLHLEREEISQSSLSFEHHFANNMYFLNLFCLNQ